MEFIAGTLLTITLLQILAIRNLLNRNKLLRTSIFHLRSRVDQCIKVLTEHGLTVSSSPKQDRRFDVRPARPATARSLGRR